MSSSPPNDLWALLWCPSNLLTLPCCPGIFLLPPRRSDSPAVCHDYCSKLAYIRKCRNPFLECLITKIAFAKLVQLSLSLQHFPSSVPYA